MTSSAGMSGLILVGSPPRACMASRIAARSTTAGTPVRSCRMTRAGVNWISVSGSLAGGDVGAILVAEQVLQQDLQAEREVGRTFRSVQPVDLVPLARDLKGRPAAEDVRCHRVLSLLAPNRAVPRWSPTY